MAVVTILEEQTLTFSYNTTYGLYSQGIGKSVTLVVGESYKVAWDGTSYDCIAQDASALSEGAVALGNGQGFGLAGNGEPFLIGAISDGTMFFALSDETATTHTVGIYQEVVTGDTILEEQTVVYDAENDNCVIMDVEPLVTGETYIVVFNGVVYECVAFDFQAAEGISFTGIGNTEPIDGVGNDIPFLIMYADAEYSGLGTPGYEIVFLDGSTSATLAIYQAAEEESGGGNALGALFLDIANSIRGKTGGTDKMAPAAFPEAIDSIDQGPEILPEVIIEPNFADGDCVDSAPEGYAIQNFTVKKPETLVPENILEGVNIAGIIGAAVAGSGGGSALFKIGQVTTTSQDQLVISHDLGVKPDLIVIFSIDVSIGDETGLVALGVGVSTALAELSPGFDSITLYSAGHYGTAGAGMDNSSISNIMGGLYATETTFTFGGKSNNKVKSGATYYWVAVGGLT